MKSTSANVKSEIQLKTSKDIVDTERSKLSQRSAAAANSKVADVPPPPPTPEESKKVTTYRYGWLGFEPACLQKIHRPCCLLVFMCSLVTVQGFIVNGVFPAITSPLEKRYHISSKEIGIINSMYDTGSLVMMLPISYFGSKGHKGRLIGMGTIVMGFGSFLCLVPHLAAGAYSYGKANQTDGLCGDTIDTEAHENAMMNGWKYAFMFGNFIHGIGASPFYTLGITYMDENVSQKTSSLYIGIFHAFSLLGPCLGYGVSAVSLGFNVDFNRKGFADGLTTSDPRFVGAWWPPFIVSGALAWILAVIVLGFGRTLPGSEKARQHDIDQAHQVTVEDIAHAPESLSNFAFVWRRLRQLICNPTYMGLTFEQVCTIFVTAGTVVFLGKYIEIQFGVEASTAPLLSAGAALPAAFGGVLLGTFIQQRFNLQCKGNVILSIFSTASTILAYSFFFAVCSSPRFAGGNVKYPKSASSSSQLNLIDPSCNSICKCSQSYYKPACFEKKTMFFSPCYAGCTEVNQSLGVATNCGCLPDNSTIVMKACERDCSKAVLVVFLIGLFLIILFVYLKQNPIQQATLRCVPFELRTFAVSIGWIPMRVFGAIPAAPIFGAIVEQACVLFQVRNGENEVCVLYENAKLAGSVQVLGVVGFTLSFISLMVAWRLYRPPSTGEPKHVPQGNTLQESMQADLSEGGVIRK